MTPPVDYRRRGACCHSASTTFIRVTGDDWARPGADAGELETKRGWAGRCAVASHSVPSVAEA